MADRFSVVKPNRTVPAPFLSALPLSYHCIVIGGEKGIRTPAALAHRTAFQAGTLDQLGHLSNLVDRAGFEPATSSMSRKRTTTVLTIRVDGAHGEN